VTTTPANYKLLVTYRNEAQGPPAGATETTAAVTGFVLQGANTAAGADPVDGRITLNNVAPALGASWGPTSSATARSPWPGPTAPPSTTPSSCVLNDTDPAMPLDGQSYAVGSALGTGVVRYVGNATGFIDDTGLTNGTAYYYRVFEFDNCRN
jgi:hypothetical protein